jgi:hypothetical protein
LPRIINSLNSLSIIPSLCDDRLVNQISTIVQDKIVLSSKKMSFQKRKGITLAKL